jgi:hypothetical protein
MLSDENLAMLLLPQHAIERLARRAQEWLCPEETKMQRGKEGNTGVFRFKSEPSPN